MNRKCTKANNTKLLFDKIIKGIENIISSGEYENFLKFCNTFHHYSFNNIILIFSQMKEATKVAGFKQWQKLGRKIKKGEKGIQIIYPIKISRNITSKDISDKELEKDKDYIEFVTYRYTYVYDISQTEGPPIPLENNTIESNNLIDFFTFLKSFSPFPIYEQELFGSLKGYWNPSKKDIVLKNSLSTDAKVSVLLHELTHALYDNFNYKENRNLSEVFVESVTFIVANYFGLNTYKFSLNYIASWSNADIKSILNIGDKIQKTANDFITKLESAYTNSKLKTIG